MAQGQRAGRSLRPVRLHDAGRTLDLLKGGLMERVFGSGTWMDVVSAWPRCSVPVTLGGGMTITNFGASGMSLGLKYPASSHHEYLPMQTFCRLTFSFSHILDLCNSSLPCG